MAAKSDVNESADKVGVCPTTGIAKSAVTTAAQRASVRNAGVRG
ncbi:hypothetical protein [Paraburkholderia sp. J8-2]|nr:hypothetical protein [Paraburkholderia sp. J8-2]